MDKISLLVVDDESSARKNILNCIDWGKIGIFEIHEAENGFVAVELIRRCKPDIIVLDLKMPGMSGVDVLGILQMEKINAKVIVSSGYSDFAAAQKMLESGKVMAYLLKPVVEDVLVEIIAKCIERIESENEAGRLAEDLKNARQQINHLALKDAILGRWGTDGNLGEYEQEFTEMAIAVAYGDASSEAILEAVMASVRQDQSGPLKDVFIGDRPHFAVLFFATGSGGLESGMMEVCGKIAGRNSLRIGIGRICKSTHDINISYSEALLACECCSFVEKCVISMDDLDIKLVGDSDYDKRVSEIKLLISQGDNEGLVNYFERAAQADFLMLSKSSEYSIGKYGNLSAVKAHFSRLIEKVFPGYQEKLNLSALFAAQDIGELLAILKKTIVQILESSQKNPLLRRITFTSRAKKYIEVHYMEKISLEIVSNAVFICPSYLSRLFTEVEGFTFVEYVTEVRMDHARLLLREYKYKIYEVAEMVGYHNIKHFIRVFKEKCGMPPSQYREKFLYDKSVKELGRN
jgi:two-component system response regulator YesN